jgi:fucose permease
MNATTVSVFRMTGDIGYIAGPLVLGLIMDLYGPEASLVVAAGLLVVMGGLFAGFAPETYRARAP